MDRLHLSQCVCGPFNSEIEDVCRPALAVSFERISDRCKNVCELVLDLMHGKDVRHAELAKAAKVHA